MLKQQTRQRDWRKRGVARQAPEGDSPLVTARILVVDDDAVTRAVITQVLQKEGGFQVTEAVDGAAALDRFSRDQPDLVLLDVIMPGPDGFKVCRKIKKPGSHRWCS